MNLLCKSLFLLCSLSISSAFSGEIVFKERVESYGCNGVFGEVRLKRQLASSQRNFFSLRCQRNGLKLSRFKIKSNCYIAKSNSCNESRWDSNSRDTILCEGKVVASCK